MKDRNFKLDFDLPKLKSDIQEADEIITKHFSEQAFDRDIGYEVEKLINFAQEVNSFLPELLEEMRELNKLFDMQYDRTQMATKMWQRANNSDVIPDLGTLIDWLMKVY